MGHRNVFAHASFGELASLLIVFGGCGARTGLDVIPIEPAKDAGFSPVVGVDGEAPTVVADAEPEAPCSDSAGWLEDSCLWEPVRELLVCDVYQARLPSSRFPMRTFESCGEGCRVTQAHVDGSSGRMSIPRGWFDDGAAYVRVLTAFDRQIIREVIDVTHNRTVAAFQTRNSVEPPNWRQCIGNDADDLGPIDIESWNHWTGDPTSSENPSSKYFAKVRYRETPRLDIVPGSFDLPGKGETPTSFELGLVAT